jgi:hypothetical protein
MPIRILAIFLSTIQVRAVVQISEMKLGHRDQAVDGSQSDRRELLPPGTIAKMTPNRSELFGSILMNGPHV